MSIKKDEKKALKEKSWMGNGISFLESSKRRLCQFQHEE
jgi:hypothetical protein